MGVSGVGAVSQAAVQMQIQTAITQKIADVTKLQQDEVLKLIESLAQEPGKGDGLDVQA